MTLVTLCVVALVAGGTLTGCGRREVPVGVLAGAGDLRGASYVVAGGASDELTVLCMMTVAAVQAAGARADEQCGKVGAVDVRGPRSASEVDTGWAYVSRPPAPDSEDPGAPAPWTDWAGRAGADAARGVVWMAPTAFSDTDALVTTPTTARAGVPSLSALADRARQRPGTVTLCATPDAVTDPRRLAGVLATYGMAPDATVRPLDAGAVLVGVARGECTAGEVPGTSGRIPALGLVALTDDRGAFGRGDVGRPGPGRGGAAPIMRSDVFAAHPQVAAVMDAVTSRLTDDAMRELNRAVTVDGRDPRDVARRWLRAQGLTP